MALNKHAMRQLRIKFSEGFAIREIVPIQATCDAKS